jgi:hypothetical protein
VEEPLIHQFIFAAPKPDLSSAAFASYWLNFHARDYAAKIPQIRRYLVATPLELDSGRDVPNFAGVAEIWLRPEEQIASLQSPEFIAGARADEPRWAAAVALYSETKERIKKSRDPKLQISAQNQRKSQAG